VSGLATKYALNICKLKGGSARGVLTALAWRSAEKNPSVVYMPQDGICECTGVTENTVRSAIEKLVAAHEVRVVKVGGVRPDGKREATDYELVGVRQWIDAGCPPREEWQGAKAEPLGLKSCTLRPQELHPSKDVINESLEKQIHGENPKPPKTTHNEEENAQKQNPSLLSFLNSERSDENRARPTRAMVSQYPGEDEAWHDWLRVEFARVGVDAGIEWEACVKYRRRKKLVAPMRADFVGWLLNSATKQQEKGGPVKPPRNKRQAAPAKTAGQTAFERELALIRAAQEGAEEPPDTTPLREAMEAIEDPRADRKIVRLKLAGQTMPQPLAAAS